MNDLTIPVKACYAKKRYSIELNDDGKRAGQENQ
jgi:hypothetical protein